MPIVCIGIIFFLFRTVCVQLLPALSYDEFTHLINLPVGISILAITIFGWIAILGIMLGWIFCHFFGGEYTLLECLYLGIIYGFTTFISVLVWQSYFHINNAFEGLTSRLLTYLALIFAFISTFFRSIYIDSINPEASFALLFLTSFVGDLVGIFFVFYTIKGGMYLYRQFGKN